MKKILSKKIHARKKELPSRITNETVAEHREHILAGGRKFKYPIQYARHKLVRNALLVAAAATILLVILGWWQLYPMQNSSAFMYRVTHIIPVPVAVVNGELVPYRDYLVLYRASDYYLGKYGEIKLSTTDGRRQLDYVKRQSLDMAEQVAYARQLARQKHITVSDGDVNSFISQERNTINGRVSQETYDASIQMLYDQTTEDYRLSVANGILKNKVAFAVDTYASARVARATSLIKNNSDFATIADQLSTMKGEKVAVGQSGFVDSTSKYGGLRVSDVASLKKGVVSGALKSTTNDGYYFVKVIDKNDSQVNFEYLHIPLSVFSDNFTKLKKDGKIHEYINVANQ